MTPASATVLPQLHEKSQAQLTSRRMTDNDKNDLLFCKPLNFEVICYVARKTAEQDMYDYITQMSQERNTCITQQVR